jgi:predicted aspartyl protease
MSETTLKPESEEMGRVTVTAKITNLEDLWRAERGEIAQEEVRSIELDDALVDTGCIGLAMPESMVAELGLRKVRTKRTRSTNGPRQAAIYQAVRLDVQERDCIVEVYGLPEDCPVLIGQLALESMDWMIDMQNQKLIGNPAHDGEWVIEMY